MFWCTNTEMLFILWTWLGDISSCSCLTVLPCPAWVLLSKTNKPLFAPLYIFNLLKAIVFIAILQCMENHRVIWQTVYIWHFFQSSRASYYLRCSVLRDCIAWLTATRIGQFIRWSWSPTLKLRTREGAISWAKLSNGASEEGPPAPLAPTFKIPPSFPPSCRIPCAALASF